MAVPKKKPSKTRQRQRHSAWRANFKPAALVDCENCSAKKRPHRVCKACGTYRGRQVLEKPTVVKKVENEEI